eukprot:899588_1
MSSNRRSRNSSKKMKRVKSVMALEKGDTQKFKWEKAHESIKISGKRVTKPVDDTGAHKGRYNVYGTGINTKKKCIYTWTFKVKQAGQSMIIGVTTNNYETNSGHEAIAYGYCNDGKKIKSRATLPFGKAYDKGSEIQMTVNCIEKTISFGLKTKDTWASIVAYKMDMSIKKYYPAINMKSQYSRASVELTDFVVENKKKTTEEIDEKKSTDTDENLQLKEELAQLKEEFKKKRSGRN